MKRLKILIVLLLCFSVKLFSQDQVLDRKVDLNYKEATLEHILKDLGVRYGVRFSYVNNIIPLSKIISVQMENKPLRDGLDAILSSTHIDYQLVNGQVVLKKNTAKKPVETSKSLKSNEDPVELPNEKETTKVPEANKEVVQASLEKATLQNATEEDTLKKEVSKLEPSISVEETIAAPIDPKEVTIDKKEAPATNDAEEIEPKGSFFKKISKKVEAKFEKIKNGAGKENKEEVEPKQPSANTDITIEYDEEDARPLHIGFVYPLSNHFTDAPKYVNKMSFHALIGVSRGVDGIEASGFGNASREFVRGAQFSGFFNLTGGPVDGIQAAGFVNVNNGDLDGAQFAGFLNVSNGNASAGSFAGFGNIRSGALNGVEFAGFINTSQDVDGMQAAGFINVAKDVEGLQLAGFLNKAKRVNGVQIGVINFADTVDGVSIGIFNFIKKGYRRFEIYGAEAFHANAAYKMGTQNFYTIFAAGARFQDDITWGYGMGFGTQQNISDSWKLSIDATCYQVVEKRTFQISYLNINNNLRVGIDKVYEHFAITFGPSFNVHVRDHFNNEDEENAFIPYSIYESTGNRDKVTMWPGFFFGIRM